MIELSFGQICIDSVDLTTVPREMVRHRINCITQETFFAHGTIRFNLDLSNSLSDTEIYDALSIVGLRDLVHVKGGLQVDLIESEWSTGQRQLLCLARAMLRKCKIIVIDEGTSR